MHTENFFDIKYKKITELIKDDNIQFSNVVIKINCDGTPLLLYIL